MMRHFFKNIILIICCFSLMSCGFHLRGQSNLAPPLKRVYIQTKDPYGQLTVILKRYLKMSGVYLAADPADATTILDILSERESEQLQSVSGTQQTRQYNLILTVTFQITAPNGKAIIPPQIVSETRQLTIQANQILAGSNEEDNLYQQMRPSIVFDIMNRLSSQEMTRLFEKSPPT